MNSADLTGTDLTDATLVWANLTWAALPGATLTRANLSAADLTGATLATANLRGIILTKATLVWADLFNGDLTEATLDWADLTQAILTRATLTRATLVGATLNSADLTGTDLTGTDLTGATLVWATLQRVTLVQANLTGANLSYATLTGATVLNTELKKADLTQANLTQAMLSEVDLCGAKLLRANLTRATLTKVSLNEVNLYDTELAEAKLIYSSFYAATFEPLSLPKARNIAFAEGLPHVRFRDYATALHELHQAFKQAGMRQQEREIVYAIKHTQRCQNWAIFCAPVPVCSPSGPKDNTGLGKTLQGAFDLLFFEVTCHYGMTPGRPLRILLALLPCFAILYMLALRRRGRSGIWVRWAPEPLHPGAEAEKPSRITREFFFPRWQARSAGKWWGWLLQWLCVPLIGLYFSILSAFHIGWRELNVGNWIVRIQPREYTLQATGWVGTVSGLQSLLSVFLLALWALTYFGGPLE